MVLLSPSKECIDSALNKTQPIPFIFFLIHHFLEYVTNAAEKHDCVNQPAVSIFRVEMSGGRMELGCMSGCMIGDHSDPWKSGHSTVQVDTHRQDHTMSQLRGP